MLMFYNDFTPIPQSHPSFLLLVESTQAQAGLYVWQCVSDDEETQKLGCVLVVFLHNMTIDLVNDATDKQYMQRVSNCIPVRKSAVHMCLPPSPFYHAIQGMYKLLSSVQERTQTRIHVGSVTECLYSLKSFGIPVKRFPSNLNIYSRDSLNQQLDWIDFRTAFETMVLEPRLIESVGVVDTDGGGSNFYANDVILSPQNEDVLFGKGKPVMRHPGNVAMRNILEVYWEKYDETEFSLKSKIAWSILFHIQGNGGRFLKEHPQYGWYIEVDNDDARRKISIALRDHVKRAKQKKRMLLLAKQSPSVSTTTTVSTEASTTTAATPTSPLTVNGTITEQQHHNQQEPIAPPLRPLPTPAPHQECLDMSSMDNPKRRKYGNNHHACGPSWFCSS
jgi:hypothetical protein